MLRAPRLVKLLVLPVAMAAVAVLALPALAAGGDLDTSWGGTGAVTTPFPGIFSFANGVAARGDIVDAVGGVFDGTQGDFAIAQYRKDGTLDPTFGGGSGEVTTDFEGGDDLADAVAYQGERLVVVGYATTAS